MHFVQLWALVAVVPGEAALCVLRGCGCWRHRGQGQGWEGSSPYHGDVRQWQPRAQMSHVARAQPSQESERDRRLGDSASQEPREALEVTSRLLLRVRWACGSNLIALLQRHRHAPEVYPDGFGGGVRSHLHLEGDVG